MFVVSLYLSCMTIVKAHDSSATYLANEAVLVSNGHTKVLFDPFFHKSFNQYLLVPQKTLAAIFAGEAPFDNIDAIVISHAHGDHFAADDVARYLEKFPATKLVAPQQAIKTLQVLPNVGTISSQLIPITLAFNDSPKTMQIGNITFEGVRIPHAGWPGRANIENIVFRVTLVDDKKGAITVMHMGDADPNDDHYLPYKDHWTARKTHMAFPPYWFFYSMEGNYILDELLNAHEHVGIHVPTIVPKELKASGKDYFSTSGERRTINRSVTP